MYATNQIERRRATQQRKMEVRTVCIVRRKNKGKQKRDETAHPVRAGGAVHDRLAVPSHHGAARLPPHLPGLERQLLPRRTDKERPKREIETSVTGAQNRVSQAWLVGGRRLRVRLCACRLALRLVDRPVQNKPPSASASGGGS